MLKKAQEIVDKLNEMIECDHDAMNTLINFRVPTNKAMSDHPTVQVFWEKGSDHYKVGIVGILNGLVGVNGKGWGYIAAVVDSKGVLERFTVIPD